MTHLWRLIGQPARRVLAITDRAAALVHDRIMRCLLIIVVLAGLLAGCETVQLKAKGGSGTGIDWGMGIRF